MSDLSRFRKPLTLTVGALLVSALGFIPKAGSKAAPPGQATPSAAPAPAAAEPLPPPDAGKLWQYIHSEANGYRKHWAAFPGGPKLLQATEMPHGDWVAVYVNPAGLPAL